MRSASKLGKLIVVVFGIVGGMSSLSARADEAFDAFWTKFVTALNNDDVETVRDLVKFPVVYNSEELGGDSFPTIYDGWFDADARACLATTTPVEDGVDYYVAYCELIYVFANTRGWLALRGRERQRLTPQEQASPPSSQRRRSLPIRSAAGPAASGP